MILAVRRVSLGCGCSRASSGRIGSIALRAGRFVESQKLISSP
jgi:hypothetical protein